MKKLFFLIGFLVISLSCFAQSDSLTVQKDQEIITQKKFNKSNIDKYKADKDFDYTEIVEVKEPTILDRILNWIGRQIMRFLEWIFGVESAKGIFKTILQILPYIVAGLVLFLLLKFFLKVNSNALVSNANNKSAVTITEEEELIKNKDLSKLILQAFQNKNYRLAVRYYYLQLLKQLEERELIVWEQQKTNEDFSKEIKDLNLNKSFVKLTRLYDFVWYGNFEINELEFTKAVSDFESVTKQLNKKKIG
ncbi:DUF4129 domain-containing protein [Lutibacter sp.]|uniref:DUF4129 domain-containing protein n=1 Tax=Lutibacter sp. TaxID=1925666 RepID=UPI00356A992B